MSENIFKKILEKKPIGSKELEQYWDSVITDEGLRAFFNGLKEREQLVIALRSGLFNHTCYSLEEIAEYFDTTPNRIKQIERKAVAKIGRVGHICSAGFQNYFSDLNIED